MKIFGIDFRGDIFVFMVHAIGRGSSKYISVKERTNTYNLFILAMTSSKLLGMLVLEYTL